MSSPFTAKEQLVADTPLFLFECTTSDAVTRYWSSQTVNWNGNTYLGRVVRHSNFEAQLASDSQIGGTPKLTLDLADADSMFSEIEQQVGFKGAVIIVRSLFFNLASGTASSDAIVVFRGLLNPPDSITENIFRLSAMNRISMQRSVLPNVRVSRMCPWRFPSTSPQRLEAVDGGAQKGRYSSFYRCGYSADQTNGVGNLTAGAPYTSCAYTRTDCETRGMFSSDSGGHPTARFGGLEFVPATILVRGNGQKNYQLSAVQSNTASYNNFVPLVYGTQWTSPDVVFSRNDGNLTRMEALLGMGEIQGVLTVLVNDIQIPQGVSGANMTSTGWWNLITAGARTGGFDSNFTGSDPYGSMACLSIVVPNRINDGTSIPTVQVLMQGMKLWQFDASGNQTTAFSDNPAWVLLDILMRCGYSLSEINTASFAAAAAWAGQLITTDDPVGGSVQLPRFQCDFALKSSQSAGQIIRSIRNASRLYIVLNTSGLIEARVEGTFSTQQPSLPPNSNSTQEFNGGWPAYEFDLSSIARSNDGSSSLTVSRRGAQDTPNRLSVEFQDAFNQYQQDSLSLADESDVQLCGQEIAAPWDAVGITTFSQASRSLLLGLNRGIPGNFFVEFETSVKALGLLPGDLITVTYPKENLNRAPFRVTRVAPGPSFRTASITAQLHDDDWYSDAPVGITGGIGIQTGRGAGLPAPVCGTVLDSHGALQLGIAESESTAADGTVDVSLAVTFAAPSGNAVSLPAPLLGLNPTVKTTGGTLPGGAILYYAVSSVDAGGNEGALSFVAQAVTGSSGNTNSVALSGVSLPVGAASFHVYRGDNNLQMHRIASSVTGSGFTDTGLAPQALLPPDPQFDHVNIYWRWELLPETQANIFSGSTLGNSTLQMKSGAYTNAVVRITRGTGAGEELQISGNSATTLSLNGTWTTVPDSSSWFAIAENSWRFGGQAASGPVAIEVPERIGSGVHISARAANTSDQEADYGLSPLTRWLLGQSGALAGDSDVPPAPLFGLTVSPAQPGALQLGAIGFTSLVNTTSISSATYAFHYYDELSGAPPMTLSANIGAAVTTIAFGTTIAAGTLVQIEQEIVRVTGINVDGSSAVSRGYNSSVAASHNSGAPAWQLSERVLILPFGNNFFGTPASGDWQYNFPLPNARLASAELSVTNALGTSPVTANCYTENIDSGLRTFSGGQYSFQVSGYLAVQSNAAPGIVVEADHSIRDIFAVLGSAPVGSGVTLQLKRNGTNWASLTFAAGSVFSSVVSGFGLTPLRTGNPGDIVTLDVTAVGTTAPGSDLTLVVRL